MQWLEGECLEYFSSWKAYAPVSKAQKSRMMLSHETMNGIFMTGIVNYDYGVMFIHVHAYCIFSVYSFVEVAYLVLLLFLLQNLHHQLLSCSFKIEKCPIRGEYKMWNY